MSNLAESPAKNKPARSTREQHHRSLKKFLLKVLLLPEVELVLRILEAEERREPLRAGKLGWAESLCQRSWLVRDPAGGLHLGPALLELLAKWERKP